MMAYNEQRQDLIDYEREAEEPAKNVCLYIRLTSMITTPVLEKHCIIILKMLSLVSVYHYMCTEFNLKCHEKKQF